MSALDNLHTAMRNRGLRWPMYLLLIIFLMLVVLICYFSIFVSFQKLDDKSEYNIDVQTEAIEYIPTISPKIYLARFVPIKHSCAAMQSGIEYTDASLSFTGDTHMLIYRQSSGLLRLTIVDLSAGSERSLTANDERQFGTLTSSLGRCELSGTLVFEIALTRENPVFVMNSEGYVKIGREISDQSHSYHPLVTGGIIYIQDRTVFNKDVVNLTPQTIRAGDTIFMTDGSGIIRATFDSAGITGVFRQKGGEIMVQHLSTTPARKVEAGFLNRLRNDNELALGLSLAVFLLQLLYFLMSTTFQMALHHLVQSSNAPGQGKRLIKRWKKSSRI